jgi:hypothetical protein
MYETCLTRRITVVEHISVRHRMLTPVCTCVIENNVLKFRQLDCGVC